MVPNALIRFDRQVLEEIDTATLGRGLAYHRQGRVSDIEVEPGGMGLLAAVEGSEPEPYEVDITITRSRQRGYVLEGYCTCPVGHNCKHVAAVLYAVLSPDSRPAATQAEFASNTGIASTNRAALSVWLEGVANAASGRANETEETPDHVRFLLKPPQHEHQTPRLDPLLSRPRRQGGYSQVRSMTMQGLAQSTAKGVTPQDRMLARLFLTARTHTYGLSNNLPDDADLTAELLERLLSAQKLHWQSLETPPLRHGSPRACHIGWGMDDKGRQVPILRVLGDDGSDQGEQAQALDRDGNVFWYVDPGQGLCGPLEPPAPLPLVRALLRAPPLDPVAAGMVAQRLPSLGLPVQAGALHLPTSAIRMEMDERPPIIRLVLVTHPPLNQKASRWTPPPMPTDRAYLAFDYDGTVLAPFGGPEDFRRQQGDRVTIRPRQRALEAQALQRLSACGILPVAPAPGMGGKTAPVPPGTNLGCHGVPEQIWLPFMVRELPQMRADGWQVEVMPGFRWQVSAVEAWEGEAQPAGYGWFDLDLGIRVDGQRVPLLPLLLDLLKRLGRNGDPDALLARDPDAQLYATLPNGAHVALPVARIAPLTRVLLDLFGGNGSLDGEGRARIDLGQAALLDGASDLDLPPLLQPEQRDRLRRLLEPVTEAEPPVGLTSDLRPYQRRGLGWLLALDAAGTGGVLADDMGLGKTLQVIAFIQTLKNEGRLKGPALVLAPTSVAPNWLREVGRHAPGLRAHLHQGLDRAKRWPNLDQIDLLVTGYPLLLRDHAILMDRTWSLLILDEAQVVKNQASKLAGLVRTLPAERRLCVTGTPLENHLGELWTQMDFVMPGLLGDSRNFGKLFRTPIEKQGDLPRRHLLAGRLRPFILRRAKGEVAGDLPPKTEIVERIPLPDDQRDLYETLRLAMDAKVRQAIAARGLARSHIVILEALLRLRQACCDPALLPKPTAKRAKEVASAKRQHLMQMLPEMVQEGRRILLFSQFTTMLDLIRTDLDTAGLSHVSLTGDSTDRVGPVDQFQSGNVDVFLISLKAGGTGLTLTAADTVIHYDPWWNPAVEDQATDRAHRIGQDKPVFVYRLVAEGTVEERILDLQDRKRQLAAAIHDIGIEGPDALTEADIDRLFAPLTG